MGPPQYKTKILGLVLQGHPEKGPPICRNSHIVLIRINSKPALYQPKPQMSYLPPRTDVSFATAAAQAAGSGPSSCAAEKGGQGSLNGLPGEPVAHNYGLL